MCKMLVMSGVAVTATLGAFGANVYWSNAGTGSWETESNWQGGGRHERLPRGDGRARLLEAN